MMKMLNISPDDLIYTGTIHIIDNDMLTNIGKHNMIKNYNLKFASLMPKACQKVFENMNTTFIDITSLEFARNASNISYMPNSHLVTNNNICIYKSMLYKDLLALLLYIFDDDMLSAYVKYNPTYNLVMKSNVTSDINTNQCIKTYSTADAYNSFVKLCNTTRTDTCIINNDDITVVISSAGVFNNIDYGSMFSQYVKLSMHYIKAKTVFKKPVAIKYNINEVSVLMVPTSDNDEFSCLDIVSMFNNIGLQNNKQISISKAYIQSNDLDRFLHNSKPTCYAYTNTNVIQPFKNIDITQDTYVIYIGKQYETCTLISISIYKYGGLMFKYHTTETDINQISEILISKTKEVFKQIVVNYFILADYQTLKHYDYTKYTFSIADISGTIIINNGSQAFLDNIITLMNNNSQIKHIYKTKTSLEMIMYCNNSLMLDHALESLDISNNIISSEKIINTYGPRFHIGCSYNKTCVLTFKNTFDINLFILQIQFIIMSLIDLTKDVEFIYTTTSTEIVDIKKLSEFARTCAKENLKQLKKEDPELFGKHNNDSTRTYSNLCQKPEQRPVIINKASYEYFRQDEKLAKSVAAINNQTYADKKLYLMCVNDKFNILNFHHVSKQKCIVRCTTQMSNKSQYDFCAKTLGLEGFKPIQITNENQMIVNYNPLLTIGRKCTMPPELGDKYSEYILISFNILNSENIVNVCEHKFGVKPFIIKRDVNKQEYSILTTAIEESKNMILLITDELRPNVYFYPVLITNNAHFFNMHNHAEFTNFINSIGFWSKSFKIFIDYMISVIPVLNSVTYNEATQTIEDIILLFVKKYDIKYVVANNSNTIMGVLIDNMLYTTPCYIYDSITVDCNSVKVFSIVNRLKNGLYKLPDASLYIKNPIYKIKYLYRDQATNKICMININDYDLLVTAYDIDKYVHNIDIITIDYIALINSLSPTIKNNNKNNKNNNKNNDKNTIKQNDGDYEYFNIITHFVFICYSNNIPINIDNIIKLMQEYEVYTANTLDLKYSNILSENKSISWSTSKINHEIIQKYFNYYDSKNIFIFVKLIINMIKNQYTFNKDTDEQMLSSKVISYL